MNILNHFDQSLNAVSDKDSVYHTLFYDGRKNEKN